MDASREEQARRIQIALHHIRRCLDAASVRAAELPITVPQMYMLYPKFRKPIVSVKSRDVSA